MQVLTPHFSSANLSIKESFARQLSLNSKLYFRGADEQDSHSDQLELGQKKPPKKMSLLRRIATTLILSAVASGSAAGTLASISYNNTQEQIATINDENDRLRQDYQTNVLAPYQTVLAELDAKIAQAQPDYDQAVTAINTEKANETALIEEQYQKDVALLNADYESRDADLKSLQQFLSEALSKAQERVQILESNDRLEDSSLVDLQAEILQEFYVQIAQYLFDNNYLVPSSDGGQSLEYYLQYLVRNDEYEYTKMASEELISQNIALIKESDLTSIQQGFQLWLQEVGLNNVQYLISRGYGLVELDTLGQFDDSVTQYFDRMVTADANSVEQEANQAAELGRLEEKKADDLAVVNQTAKDKLAALPSVEATVSQLRQEKAAYEKEQQPAPFDESQLKDPDTVKQETNELASGLGMAAGASLIASLMALGLSAAQAKLVASKKSKKEIEAAIQAARDSDTSELDDSILRSLLEPDDKPS